MGSEPEKSDTTPPPPEILHAEFFRPRLYRFVLYVVLPAIIFMCEKGWIPFQPAALLGACIFVLGSYLEHREKRAMKEHRHSN